MLNEYAEGTDCLAFPSLIYFSICDFPRPILDNQWYYDATYLLIFASCNSKFYIGRSFSVTLKLQFQTKITQLNSNDVLITSQVTPPHDLTTFCTQCPSVYSNYCSHHIQLYDLHVLLQLQYHDSRLAYYSIAPNMHEISGGEDLQQMIWTPHVYLVNNQRSQVMGALRKDVMVTVYPDGKVIFAQR